MISQTSFSQDQITSDSEIARSLFKQGLLTSPAVPFPGKGVLAFTSSLVLPGTGQFIKSYSGFAFVILCSVALHLSPVYH